MKPARVQFDYCLCRENEQGEETEYNLCVSADIWPGGGDGWYEPEYPAEAEVWEVVDDNFNDFAVTAEEMVTLQEAAFKEAVTIFDRF